MFQGLINHAKSAAGSLIAKYVARASVAVPFVLAFGFATAGVTLMLIERFGHRNAYFIVSGGFTVLGLLAALLVRNKEHEEIVADEQAVKADTADVAMETATAAAAHMPLALIGALFSTLGPSSLANLVRTLGRHLPLALLLGAIAVLLWPKPFGEKRTTATGPDPSRIDENDSHDEHFQITPYNLNAGDHYRPRGRAIGTFLIGAIIIATILYATFGPSGPAVRSPHVIGMADRILRSAV